MRSKDIYMENGYALATFLAFARSVAGDKVGGWYIEEPPGGWPGVGGGCSLV